MITQIKAFVKNNHFYCMCIAIVLVMSFGFYATHYSFNEDVLVSEYYSGTVLMEAGRFSAPLIHWFTNWMEFAPFWHTVAMGILLFVSGLAMALVFKELSDGKIADSSLFVFWIFFATYPMIAYQLTYPILSVILPYYLVSVAMWQIIPLIKGGKIGFKNIVLAIGCLVVSVDMYESHATVFLTMLFGGLLVIYLYTPTEKTKNIINFTKTVGIACGILLVAIIIDFGVSKLVCYIASGTTEFWYTKNTTLAWGESAPINIIKWLVREILARYVITGVSNYGIWLFDVAVLVGGLGSFIYSVKKRSLWCVLLYAAVCVSSLSLAVVRGFVPYFRMAQALPVPVALFMMLIAENVKGKKLVKKIALCIFVILILNQSLFINRYSVINYQRHECEQNIIVDISKDLKYYPLEEKPVLFINDDAMPYICNSTPLTFDNPIGYGYSKIMCKIFDVVIPRTTFKRLAERYSDSEKYGLVLNNSENIAKYFNLYNCVILGEVYGFKTCGEHFLPEIYRNFDINGCKLIVPVAARNVDNYKEIKEKYRDMPGYPYDGYIKETDDMIIVKIYGDASNTESN